MKRTLKNKLTLAYAIGVCVSLALCFAAIYLVQRHMLLRSVNAKLDYFANEFRYEYLSVEAFTPRHGIVRLQDIPGACLQRIEREQPGFRVASAIVNPDQRLEVLGEKPDGEILRFVFPRDNPAPETVEQIGAADRVAHMRYEFNEESHGEGKNRFFFILFSPAGEILTRSPFDAKFIPEFVELNFSNIADAAAAEADATHHSRHFPPAAPGYIRNNGVRVRTLRGVFSDGNVLFLGANLNDLDRNLNRLLGIFCAGLAGMLAVSLFIGRIIAGKVSASLNRVTSAAREIGAGDYSKRVGAGDAGLEIGLLADAFNDMTGKTERLIDELKNISENIAHDLRTPLTRMRGVAEVSLYSDGAPELAGTVAEECGDMLEMINTMLEITQTEYRFDSARMTVANLNRLVSLSLDLFSTIADDKRITLTSRLPETGEILFLCHESKIQRMIANLLDNALKYTPPGGAVSVALAQDAGRITLTISDTGCGISPADLPHVFGRFYRSGASRTLPGNGLGLSLVRAIVLAHDGEINLQSVPDKGTVFMIKFPRHPLRKP